MSKSKGIGPPTFLFVSDGIGAQNILFDREGSGSLGFWQFLKEQQVKLRT